MVANKKIVHLSSAHPRDDVRIFRKMAMSASKHYDVLFIVADGLGQSVIDGIKILDAGKRSDSRLRRMTSTVDKVYKKALKAEGDLYHLHDPELIPIGLKLKRKGFKVIFDAHEDLPKQLRSKPYLNSVLKRLLPFVFEAYEKFAFKKFDAVVGATPAITKKLAGINPMSYNINNYPILGELKSSADSDWSTKRNEVCYLGGISEIRGITELVAALPHVSSIRLNLAGRFSAIGTERDVKASIGWEQVNALGFINRREAADVLARSKAGIVTFHDYPNHVDAQPNKMFEYMSAGLPIIASNFALWKQIVEGNHCGICVDPRDSSAIADAISYILENPKEAQRMGSNSLTAVKERYNWLPEEKTLISMYKRILS
ncbi:glycosyltransferase [Pseudomonadales bacterium]|nr:glycosyltransferase [Pseudomonadales bacterium]